jgi:nucleotide-binding universal stress UspA family protein
MTYKRILVPVDGGSTSDKGLDEAAKLARGAGAKFLLLHIVDDTVAFSSPEGAGVNLVLDALRASGQEVLEKAAARARRARLQAKTLLVDNFTGRVAEAIVEQAKRWRADLIVMGTHGRRGMNRLLLGSNAELVIRNSTVPVLLVPSQMKRGAARKRR